MATLNDNFIQDCSLRFKQPYTKLMRSKQMIMIGSTQNELETAKISITKQCYEAIFNHVLMKRKAIEPIYIFSKEPVHYWITEDEMTYDINRVQMSESELEIYNQLD